MGALGTGFFELMRKPGSADTGEEDAARTEAITT
jgi:hypothetical protein